MTTERSQKANEIIHHTRQLLVAGGYNSFSYADLAEKVQIRKASIHHHFPAKADLVKTVVTEYRQEAQAGMAAINQHISDPLAGLNAYVNFWATCIKDDVSPFCICVMLAVELPSLPADIAAEVTGHFTDLAGWLTAILTKGENSGVFTLNAGADVEAKAVMATVHGAMLAARALRNPDVFMQIVHPVVSKLTRPQ